MSRLRTYSSSYTSSISLGGRKVKITTVPVHQESRSTHFSSIHCITRRFCTHHIYRRCWKWFSAACRHAHHLTTILLITCQYHTDETENNCVLNYFFLTVCSARIITTCFIFYQAPSSKKSHSFRSSEQKATVTCL
jgi:hypothetical protein